MSLEPDEIYVNPTEKCQFKISKHLIEPDV